MAEVAIIGSGAAGLVTARHIIRCGIRSSLFDSRERLGGAWSATVEPSESPAGQQHQQQRPQMWKNLVPNLSKYTCAFSDLPWSDETPTFPSLLQMDSYIQDYANKFVVDDPLVTTRLGCTVTSVSRSESSKYQVEWKDCNGVPSGQLFDGVVIATGFLAEPKVPDNLVDKVTWEKGRETGKLVHSAQYSDPDLYRDLNVAVVGGSFSAHEICSDVRQTAKNVVSIMGDTYHYILPRYLPYYEASSSGPTSFAPIDCVLYQRSTDTLSIPETTVLTSKDCQRRHHFLRKLVGTTKLEQLAAKGFPALPPTDSPPMVSISDTFTNLVIDDKIKVSSHRLAQIHLDDHSGKPILTLDNGSVWNEDDFDKVILCTGYHCNLEILSDEILATLEHNASDTHTPILAFHDTLHPDLPGLGFVGMYRGSYFGVVELQARLVAQHLSGKLDGVLDKKAMEQGLAMSRERRHSQPRAQFPHFDYIGMMDSLAEIVGLAPTSDNLRRKGSFVVPAFYQPSVSYASTVASKVEAEMRSTMKLGSATLNALVGVWTFDREIEDHLSCSRQIVRGTIRFSFQEKSCDSLRYREDGTITLSNGMQLDVFREYDYVAKGNVLEIFFVENGERTYTFLELMFRREDAKDDGSWVATSDHLCVKDLYTVRSSCVSMVPYSYLLTKLFPCRGRSLSVLPVFPLVR